MIRLKKKQDDEKAAEAAMDVEEPESSNAAVQPKAGEEKAGSALHVLGIGGRRAKRGTAKASGTKKTPGEIRIQKDIADLDGGSVAEITFPNPNNLTSFRVRVKPDSGFWKGASYDFTFTIPALYPHDPPKVLCETKIYHPNINLQGNVCLNILREDWKPQGSKQNLRDSWSLESLNGKFIRRERIVDQVLDINAVIYGLIYLFYEPNPEDPLNHEAAELYRENITQFERTVKKTLAGCVLQGETFQRLI